MMGNLVFFLVFCVDSGISVTRKLGNLGKKAKWLSPASIIKKLSNWACCVISVILHDLSFLLKLCTTLGYMSGSIILTENFGHAI